MCGAGGGIEVSSVNPQTRQGALAELDEKMDEEVLQVRLCRCRCVYVCPLFIWPNTHVVILLTGRERMPSSSFLDIPSIHPPTSTPTMAAGDPQVLQAEAPRVRQAAGGHRAGPRVLVPRGACLN